MPAKCNRLKKFVLKTRAIPPYSPTMTHLTPLQHYVTKENGTEPPFANPYWNHKAEGLYVDVISGAVLFASVHKFDSGTGWPSFTQPVDGQAVVEKPDTTHGMRRTEVRSLTSDAHLGHVFPDGPEGGLRYCINSAALRFVPKDNLRAEGYGDYLGILDRDL